MGHYLGTLITSSFFNTVRVLDFLASGGWRKIEIVRVLTFLAYGG